MTGTHYRRGDQFEKRVSRDLTANGYICWQTRGSKSAADILALKSRQVLLVQVKSGASSLSGTEWNALAELAWSVGAVPIVADRDGRKIAYRVITGRHAARSSYWPCSAFTVDELAAGVRS